MLNTAKLLRWYRRHHRALPWRRDGIDPYYVLVSETMLQQTQVATVVPYFGRFIAEFPDLQALANSDEQHVLRLWQGLGYYSRARNLRAAAKQIVERFGGKLPSDLTGLQSLPGIGRYTAGAIASIAFEKRAPILDGNVARVLCRVFRIETDPREPATRAKLWQLAEDVLPTRNIGAFNQAMMELGATICTPRNPDCASCPLRRECRAFAAGVQDRIPVARKTRPTPKHRRWTFCIQRAKDNRWLIEQRPSSGRWAGMWQFATIEAPSQRRPTVQTLHAALAIKAEKIAPIGKLRHALTHRRYEFDVYHCMTSDGANLAADRPRKWIALNDLHRFPLPGPHLKIADLLRFARQSRESYIPTGERALASRLCSDRKLQPMILRKRSNSTPSSIKPSTPPMMKKRRPAP